MGVTTANASFHPDGKFFYLTGPNNIVAWIQEITCIAKALSCYDEMTRRFISFPAPNTIQLFICETRFATAFRVLEATIAGQVWAYMRVLGYSSIPVTTETSLMSPTPADCYEFAQMAASRMLIPGTPEQPRGERKRMVEEILTAQSTDYPSERSYKKGIKWLRLACDNLIKQGDHDLAISLYDPVPDWAQRPAGYDNPAATTDASGTGPAAPSERNEEKPASSVPISTSPVEQAVEAPSANVQASATPTIRKPTPSQTRAKKRKRAEEDEGSGVAQANKIQPGNTVGA